MSCLNQSLYFFLILSFLPNSSLLLTNLIVYVKQIRTLRVRTMNLRLLKFWLHLI